MMTRSYQGWFGAAPLGRRGALLLVLLAHVGALLWVQAAHTVRLAHPAEQWIDLLPFAESGRPARPPALQVAARGPANAAAPASRQRASAEPPRPRAETPPRPAAPPAAPVGNAADMPPAASPSLDPLTPALPAPAPPAGEVAAGTPPAPAAATGLTARALAAAGAADRAERKGKAAPLSAASSPRQKLANAIEAATAGPRLWQAPRITQLKDNTGYGRQIYKVETGLTTYCLVVESNHALDGRDVIRDGISKKTVSCPIEF